MKKLLVLVLLALCAGCVSQPGNGSNQSSRFEFFSWWTAGGEAEGLDALTALYASAHPGVEIVNSTIAGGAGVNAKQVLATRMQAHQPPDSFQVHAGHEIDQYLSAGLEPLDALVFDPATRAAFPAGLLDILSIDGHIYSVPVDIHRVNMLWYNKRLFDRLQIAPPTDIPSMQAALLTLARNGITPIALGDSGIWASIQLFESQLIAVLDADGYRGLWNGRTSWNSEGVQHAVRMFGQLLNFANQDHSTLFWWDAVDKVIDGTCGMTVMGDWAEGYFESKGQVPGEDFGWVPIPGTAGVFDMLSDTFCLPVGAPHRSNAVNWLRLCASQAGQDAFNPLKGSIPARIDGDRNLYNQYSQSAIADWTNPDTEIVPSLAHGAAAAPPWISRISDIITTFAEDVVSDQQTAIDTAVSDLASAALEALSPGAGN